MKNKNSNPKTISVEVKKVNKLNKEIEWTGTLEIPYEKNDNQENNLNDNKDQTTSHLNPFHEPNMNTIEFNNNNTTTIVNLIKDNNFKITTEEKTVALKVLLDNKIISQEEFEEKNKLIIQEIKNK